LGNLVLGVIGVGVIYAIAGLINLAVSGNFLFFKKTDSGKKLDEIKKNLESLKLAHTAEESDKVEPTPRSSRPS
jgi:hypothetical protein